MLKIQPVTEKYLNNLWHNMNNNLYVWLYKACETNKLDE